MLQARLQCGSDAGCAVPGDRGAHLLGAHAPGGHPALSAHSRAPPHPPGPSAPATQPQAAGRGILGKNVGSPPRHCPSESGEPAGTTLPWPAGLSPLGPWEREPRGLQEGTRPASLLCPPPHLDLRPDARREQLGPSSTGKGGGRGGWKGGGCSLAPSPRQKIPSNFVSPEDLDIPGHASKDRYKTILPSKDCGRGLGLEVFRRQNTASARRELPYAEALLPAEECPHPGLAGEGEQVTTTRMMLGQHCSV